MNKTNSTVPATFAAIGGLVATGLASLACIGPIAAAVLGLGGSFGFARFAELRIPALVVTVLLFAVGFYAAYRGGSECTGRRMQRTRALLWVAATLTLAVYLFEFVTLPRLG